MATIGDLKVWWIPQVPGKAFEVPVETLEMGLKLVTVLAAYDLFQFEQKVKPDYTNVGGVMRFEGWTEAGHDAEWIDIEASELWAEWAQMVAVGEGS